ncbi:MAG: TetR/AcrR family transcriptional regulator [Clostridiales bacterium]|nr:TetR/AcrR family transcriptional regulator [Clostridiales bacterium]
MINAGFYCFGRDGYRKTAMSEAARQAGVSKAALFHYFGSKKSYFIYIYTFACEEILRAFRNEGVIIGSDDYFENVRAGARIKHAAARDYPGMYDFLMNLAREADAELIDELKEINKEGIIDAVARLNANVDWSRFKSPEDRIMAENLAFWVSFGLTHAADSKGKSWQQLFDEHSRYLELIKRATYKEEYL